MKLIELHPEWIDVGDFKQVGMLLDCPVHHGSECIYPRIPVYFANPPSGAPMLPKRDLEEGRWNLNGTSFEDMTLVPSILYPRPKYGPQHWHGFITNGEVT